jgi:hypothetical protein
MNRSQVDPIANAVLYEGYILYPYRPSTKNRQRWTFGGLYPEAYCRGRVGIESAAAQTECLVRGGAETHVEAVIRFLHLTNRSAGEIEPPLIHWPSDREPHFSPVASVRVGDREIPAWQEAEEREVCVEPRTLGELAARPLRVLFSFSGGRRLEPIRDVDGEFARVLVRVQKTINGVVDLCATDLGEGLYRVTIRVTNETRMEDNGEGDRDSALLQAFVSAHAILGVIDGEFVSLLDPPESWREEVDACRNEGLWPVLVGDAGQRDMMLASPIILYDYPQIAPESPGEFFDGTEIDEMLTLRVLTMTDDEKRAMAGVDERARALLARVQEMTQDEMLELHGTVRGLRPVSGESVDG